MRGAHRKDRQFLLREAWDLSWGGPRGHSYSGGVPSESRWCLLGWHRLSSEDGGWVPRALALKRKADVFGIAVTSPQKSRA